jgi:hypothetical protein
VAQSVGIGVAKLIHFAVYRNRRMALPSAATPSGLVSKSIEGFVHDAFQGCDFFFCQLCEFKSAFLQRLVGHCWRVIGTNREALLQNRL